MFFFCFRCCIWLKFLVESFNYILSQTIRIQELSTIRWKSSLRHFGVLPSKAYQTYRNYNSNFLTEFRQSHCDEHKKYNPWCAHLLYWLTNWVYKLLTKNSSSFLFVQRDASFSVLFFQHILAYGRCGGENLRNVGKSFNNSKLKMNRCKQKEKPFFRNKCAANLEKFFETVSTFESLWMLYIHIEWRYHIFICSLHIIIELLVLHLVLQSSFQLAQLFSYLHACRIAMSGIIIILTWNPTSSCFQRRSSKISVLSKLNYSRNLITNR